MVVRRPRPPEPPTRSLLTEGRGRRSSAARGDNLVGSTAAAGAFAKEHAYSPYAPSIPLLAAGMPLKRFYSAKLNDSLTTAAAAGLAFAADPANGYVLQSAVEGFCSPTPLSAGIELVQWWSSQRADSFLAPKTGPHADAAAASGYTSNFTECYTAAVTGWVTWPHAPKPNSPFPMSEDLLGWQYNSGVNPGYGGGDHTARSADTWYPTWGADGNLYSPWTDGSVHDDVTGQRVGSGSGGKTGQGYNSTTGQAVIVGDDPLNLTITKVKTFTSSTAPYQGRYPCGSLMFKGNWWYGEESTAAPPATQGGRRRDA